MAGIDFHIVQEYFEMNGFFVRQLRKNQVSKRGRKSKKQEDEIDLMVMNPRSVIEERELNFMLFANDLRYIRRAILSVKGWHTMRFTPGILRSSSGLFRFLERDVLKRAEELFSTQDEAPEDLHPFHKILVLPGLPIKEPHRSQSIALLQEHGVDAIISFRAMLQEMIQRVEPVRNYDTSELLQTIRLLKNYDMLKDPQMELFQQKT